MKKLLALFLTVALLATLALSVALTVGAEDEGYYLATSVPKVGDKIVIAFKNGEDFYAFPSANHGSDTAIAATKITVENGLASVDDSVVFELIEKSGEMAIKSIAATKDSYIGFNSNKIACNGWGDTKYAKITAGEKTGLFIVGSSNNSPRGLTYSGTDFTVSNDGGMPVYIFVYGAKPEESSESDESSEAESSEEPSSEEPSSEEPSSEEPSSEEPSSEEPSSEPDESSEEPDGASDTYVLVESDDLKSGDKIILVAKNKDGKNFASGVFNQKYIKAAEVTVSEDNKIVVGSTSEVAPITVSKTEDGWTLTLGEKAICTDAAKALNIENKGSCYWTISIDEDTHIATVASAKDGCGRFLYNAQDPRFVNYTSNTSATMILPQIYKLVENKEEEGVVVSLGSKVKSSTFSLRLGAKYNGKLLSADERATVTDLGIVLYPSKFLEAADALDLTTEGAAKISATGIDGEYYVDGKAFVDYETFVFYATIVNIPENGRDTDISFRPFIIYSTGETEYGEVLARNYNDTLAAAREIAVENSENEISCPSNWFN